MRPPPLVALIAGALLTGCAANGDPPTAASASPAALVQEASEMVATVEAVDLAERSVTLVGSEGQPMVLGVGSEVRNLEQVEVGDQVVVRYREALAAELRQPGQPARVGQVTESLTEAPLGAKPEAEVARQITTTVRIQAVDPDGPTLSFTEPNGVVRMIRVQNPAMQAFARNLNPGDEVDITYTEAVALSVEPAPR